MRFFSDVLIYVLAEDVEFFEKTYMRKCLTSSFEILKKILHIHTNKLAFEWNLLELVV